MQHNKFIIYPEKFPYISCQITPYEEVKIGSNGSEPIYLFLKENPHSESNKVTPMVDVPGAPYTFYLSNINSARKFIKDKETLRRIQKINFAILKYVLGNKENQIHPPAPEKIIEINKNTKMLHYQFINL